MRTEFLNLDVDEIVKTIEDGNALLEELYIEFQGYSNISVSHALRCHALWCMPGKGGVFKRIGGPEESLARAKSIFIVPEVHRDPHAREL